MGSLTFSAQYLQRPVPLEGNLIKRGWIKWYDRPRLAPPARRSYRAGMSRAHRRCTRLVGVHDLADFKRNYYLLDVWRGRLEFPRLKHQLIALARDHAPNRILIEQAGPGLHLIQEFRANPVPGVPMPIGIKPAGDKLVRMEAQCARFEAGQVYLPREAPWLSDLLHENPFISKLTL